jgi:hypothetical protein
VQPLGIEHARLPTLSVAVTCKADGKYVLCSTLVSQTLLVVERVIIPLSPSAIFPEKTYQANAPANQ